MGCDATERGFVIECSNAADDFFVVFIFNKLKMALKHLSTVMCYSLYQTMTHIIILVTLRFKALISC